MLSIYKIEKSTINIEGKNATTIAEAATYREIIFKIEVAII